MRKKELLAAAVDRRADVGLQNAWCQMVKRDYECSECYKYRFSRLLMADIIRVREKEILQVSMWIHSGGGGMVDIPQCYVFIDREAKEWITYDLVEEKWYTARMSNLNYPWRGEMEKYESKETTRLIQRYFRDATQSGYITIRNFMEDQGKARRISQRQKELNEIDKVMKQVPGIPEGFREWALDDAIKECRYIYYHAGRNVRYGYCTHCKKLVRIIAPKHNQEGICPECNSRIIYKADGKAAPVINREKCMLFQRMKGGGYVIRYFYIYREILKERYMKPEERIWEEKRIVLDEWMRPRQHYLWGVYPVIKKMRWCKGGFGYDFTGSGRMYPYNMAEELKDSDLRYVPLGELMAKTEHIIKVPTKFMGRAEDNYRVTEYLIKCRLYSLAADFLESDRLELSGFLNVNARNILECLNISKEQLNILQKYDGDTEMIRLIAHSNWEKVKLTEEQIHYMWENYVDWKFIRHMKNTTPHKMLKYIDSCKRNTQYLDYLDIREKEGYDMTDQIILYPKNLKEAHDKMVLEINTKEAEKRLKEVRQKFPAIEDMYEELDKAFTYVRGNYYIRPARSAEEIVMEGRLLHHCVGGDRYLDKHNRGVSFIFMLRDKETPGKPWYTVEYDREHNRIMQYYSEYDKQPDKGKVRKWLDGWLKEIEKRTEKTKTPIAV